MLSLFPGGQEASELRGAVPWEWRMCVAHLKWHGCTGGRFLVSAKAACSPGYKSFSLNSVIAGAWRFTEWRGQPLNFSFCFYVSLSPSLPPCLPSFSRSLSIPLSCICLLFFFSFFLLIASQSNCSYSLEYMVNNSFWIAHLYKGPDSL